MNHKKLALKTISTAEAVFIVGQEYYRDSKIFVHITCLVDRDFAAHRENQPSQIPATAASKDKARNRFQRTAVLNLQQNYMKQQELNND
ncbi:hypothetical protein [Canibacter oris]|nr:hypothetical protein [Canibacter oris]